MNGSPRARMLVLTSTLPRFASDPEPRFVLDLARAMSNRFDVTILAPADPDAAEHETMDGVAIRRYRYAPFRRWERLAYPGAIVPRLRARPRYWVLVPLLMLGLLRAALQELKHGTYDCVHCHWLLPQGAVMAFVRLLRPIPTVVTCHGSDVYTLNHGLGRWIKRFVVSNVSAVTVVSYPLRGALAELTHQSDAAFSVIPMGVDLDKFRPDRADRTWPSRCGLARPLILFVGRLSEEKGIDCLLRALCTRELQAASLAIVGEGPLRERLGHQIDRLGLVDRAVLLGPLGHDELPVAYASADVFCLPSVGSSSGAKEGVPTVLLEAAASGLPCVASRIGGVPDAVIDGATGILVEPGSSTQLASALARLLNNEALRRAMGGKAKQHARSFAWLNVAENFASIFALADRRVGEP
jgi:glycosyltransferase involved in cell wall biosynthesis